MFSFHDVLIEVYVKYYAQVEVLLFQKNIDTVEHLQKNKIKPTLDWVNEKTGIQVV